MRLPSSRRCCLPVLVAAGMFLLFLWTHSARGEGGEPRYFAIINARIVTVAGPPIEKGTVVIARGLIQAVGTSVAIPPEAWVIDGAGLTVYPGLIDAGTDLGLPKPEGTDEAARADRPRPGAPPAGEIASGPQDRPATTPWRVAADEIKTSDKRIAAWRNAGFTTTLSLPAGGIFPGQGSVINLAGERAGDFVVKPDAALPVSLKGLGGFFSFPGSLMGTVAYVRQVYDDARWFAQAEPISEANPGKSERLPYDRTERVINGTLERKEIVLLSANNSVEILRALRLAAEWKVPAVLFGGQEGYDVAGAIATSKIAVLVNLKWPERAKDADPEAEQTLRELRFRDRASSTPAALAKAGAKFAFYSGGLAAPKDIFKSVRKAMEAGLAPESALRAFTMDAAEILGVSERLGTIEPGKIANVVVADGDIFNEKAKVKDVFIDGRWFEIHEEAPPDKPAEKKPERVEETATVDGEVGR